jgi:hypothetical protein
MPASHHFSSAIKVLLFTVATILVLNFSCARGAGVELLSYLNYVPAEDVGIRDNILKGVDLMQSIIKFTAVIGLIFCGRLFIKGLLAIRKTNLLQP